jgi:hypothetical protein
MAGIWAFIPAASVCLFAGGTGAVARVQLAVHFGGFVIVSASIYFSAILRGFWAPAEASLWSETVDVSAVALSSVCQALCLIGDRIALNRDPSLRLTRRVQIDERLGLLVNAEDEGAVEAVILF